ncbi:MAG TPA: DUF222 domain-containing protein [Intrasporangium sp.]|uniref:HNH endonuclease n=1 Tax=Intrasporangium sp. TaxID=1925024 RepID=UPI002D769377|nr:DUF222 domain-containing protein [Intrasporangium sp.]HET7399312.1 DUF222 domain-containing protein [Intrasporangium sp.]
MNESAGRLSTGDLEALVTALPRLDDRVDDRERIDQLALLERAKAALAAAQVRVTAALVRSQEQVAAEWRERARECSDRGDFDGWRAARDQARRASVPDEAVSGPRGGRSERRPRGPRAGTGIAAQVALARRESPTQGARHLNLALTLTGQMPHTLAALEAGELTEWRAMLIVRETAVLTPEQRTVVDAQIAGPLADQGERLGSLGDRELVRRVQAIAYRIDAASVVARSRRAESDRRVTTRPAPDTMAYLTALLPVAQAVAVQASLTVAADTARAAGDARSKGQVMADTLVTRVTGQSTAEAVPVEVQLVMTDRALLAGDDTPAQLTGYGTVPASWARDLLTTSAPADSASAAARAWLRRLYTHPADGTLVAMDSTRRVFDGALRRYLVTRDAGTCRTPWCDAPIRHLDHVVEHAAGGPTHADNGQGLCVRCNHAKQHPGWHARTLPPGIGRSRRRHTVETTTPTGHTYASTAPPLVPGLATAPPSALERHLLSVLAA